MDNLQTKYFRRIEVPMRTPTMDRDLYADYRNLIYPPGSKMRDWHCWSDMVKVNGLFGRTELVARPRNMHASNNSMHVASTQLVVDYFPPGGYIQYAGDAPY